MIEIEHKGTRNLNSERLLLRQFSISDAESMFYNWANDSKVTKFLTWQPHKNIDQTKILLRKWIAQYTDSSFYQWAIVLKEIDEPIGTISVVSFDENTNTAIIGYCIGQKWWHRGYTSEALKTLLPFLFGEVKISRIKLRHDVNNPNSGGVMKKCGLHFKGILNAAIKNNRGIVDAAVYELSADEFFKTADKT